MDILSVEQLADAIEKSRIYNLKFDWTSDLDPKFTPTNSNKQTLIETYKQWNNYVNSIKVQKILRARNEYYTHHDKETLMYDLHEAYKYYKEESITINNNP